MTKPTRTIVMTGATRGIGRKAATSLLRAAPDVQLVVLARSGGEALAADLERASGNPNVGVVTMDLTSLGSIRAATAQLRRGLERGALPPLPGLIGNAGVQFCARPTPPPTATRPRSGSTSWPTTCSSTSCATASPPALGSWSPPATPTSGTSNTPWASYRPPCGATLVPWRHRSRRERADRRPHGVLDQQARPDLLRARLGAAPAREPRGVLVQPGSGSGNRSRGDAGPISRFLFARVMPVMTLTPFARSVSTSGADLAAAMLQAVAAESGAYINGSQPENSSNESYDHQREEALWAELTRLALGADKQAER